VLVGHLGANGKSTLLYVLRQLFPREAVQAIEPQLWSNVFHLAELVGARINSVNELPDADVVAGEKFKAVVSGDAVSVAHKHREGSELAAIREHAAKEIEVRIAVDTQLAAERAEIDRLDALSARLEQEAMLDAVTYGLATAAGTVIVKGFANAIDEGEE
jgi:hypothetical protein